MKRIVILIGLVVLCGCSTSSRHKTPGILIDVPYGETQRYASLV